MAVLQHNSRKGGFCLSQNVTFSHSPADKMVSMQRRFRITLTETVEVTETLTILVEGRAAQKESQPADRTAEIKQFPVGSGRLRRPYRFHKRKTHKRYRSK